MTEKKLLSFRARVVKDINEQLVLKLIQEHGIISSSDLVNITGMRPSTIFNILKGLSAKAIVNFHGKGISTDKGGKKPYLWTLNKESAYVIGLDIEIGEITAVILDFSGGIIAKKIIKLQKFSTLDELASIIIKVTNQIVDENSIDTEKVLGLGVAFAGVVDYSNGIVIMSSLLPEMNFPLLDKLSSLPFPVLVENNANAAAIGLKWNGYVKNKRNFITVLTEIDKGVGGLGIGIIIEGELYRGASFSAGELHPHLPTLQQMLVTIRTKLSEGKILKEYVSDIDAIDMDILIAAAKSGDEIATMVFSKIGDIVGQTIAPAIALLNPEALIITGILSEMEDVIIDSIRKAIELRVLSVTCSNLNLLADKHHQYAVAVGAASLILEDYFSIPLK